jgi:hypothetical protein
MKIRTGGVILLLMFVASIAHAKAPTIEDGKISFANGKIVTYIPNRVINSNPEEAHKKGEPVSISEKPVLIDSWRRLVLIKTSTLYEDKSKEITIYDYDGNILKTAIPFVGDSLFLKKTKRIFLAQQSAHNLINKSFLLDENGQLLKEIEQSHNVFDYGHSKDDKVIWLLSNAVKDGKPFTTIKIFDYNGNVIKAMESEREEKINFQYNGVSYEFTVKAPKMPG